MNKELLIPWKTLVQFLLRNYTKVTHKYHMNNNNIIILNM